jgi:hypothetical protein
MRKKQILENTIAVLLGVPFISLAIVLPAFADDKKTDKTTQSDTATKTKAKKVQVEDDSVFELGELTVSSARARSGKLSSRDILSSVDIMNADNKSMATRLNCFIGLWRVIYLGNQHVEKQRF